LLEMSKYFRNLYDRLCSVHYSAEDSLIDRLQRDGNSPSTKSAAALFPNALLGLPPLSLSLSLCFFSFIRRDVTSWRWPVAKTVGGKSRFIAVCPEMGVGFQLNMIDGETFLSAGFPGDAEERAVPRDKYFRSLFVCADVPDCASVSESLDT